MRKTRTMTRIDKNCFYCKKKVSSSHICPIKHPKEIPEVPKRIHNDDCCDRCNGIFGKENLIKLPFLFCDKNDTEHEDLSFLLGLSDEGYRQYYCCPKCLETQTNKFYNKK